MPKRSQGMIEEDTLRLLVALQKNAKENINTIARQCHMSKERCIRTIKHLEKNHTIWGYTAIVDDQDPHVKKFVVLVRRTIKKFDEHALDEIVSTQFRNVYSPLGVTIESSYYIHGDYNWMVIFTAPDLIQAKKFSKILFDFYPGIAAKVDLMQIIFTNKAYYIPNPDQTKLKEYI
jgi:DNA-binding Lrp family transcriptional regulator